MKKRKSEEQEGQSLEHFSESLAKLMEELDQEQLRKQQKAEAQEVAAKAKRKGRPLAAELDEEVLQTQQDKELLAERADVLKQMKQGAQRKLEV